MPVWCVYRIVMHVQRVLVFSKLPLVLRNYCGENPINTHTQTHTKQAHCRHEHVCSQLNRMSQRNE